MNLIVLIAKGSLQLLIFYVIIYDVKIDILFSYTEQVFNKTAHIYTAGENL